MSPRTDRYLTRLWIALAAPPVLAAGLHLGMAVGAGRWPDIASGAAAAPRREGAGTQSRGGLEPAEASLVEGCRLHTPHAKLCRLLPEK